MKTTFIKMILASSLTLITAETKAKLLQLTTTNEGTYEVPVKDPNLSDTAQFKLRYVHLEQDGNMFQLRYLVPVELTGEINFVEFAGTIDAGQGTLNYGENKMNCLADQSTLMCKVAYQDLKFDQAKVEKILGQRFHGNELRKRLSIQKDFSTDPVGVVKIKLK